MDVGGDEKSKRGVKPLVAVDERKRTFLMLLFIGKRTFYNSFLIRKRTCCRKKHYICTIKQVCYVMFFENVSRVVEEFLD